MLSSGFEEKLFKSFGNRGISILAYLFIITALFPCEAFSQGNLLITPRRVVFEGNRRSFDLNLANIGSDTATYAISFVQIRMKEDGSFESITKPDPGQKFADQNLRYFPRQVTLAPNESQVVKLQVLRANQLSPGEYRSHMYFRSIPKVKPLGEKDLVDSSAISVQITPIFGITIPIIIRVGQLNAGVTLSDLSLEKIETGTPSLKLKFNRSGDASVYGDLSVDHIATDGTVTRVGIANGIAVYTPNTSRYFSFNLINNKGIDFKSGRLKAVFSAPTDVKPQKYAEAELLLK
jgi:hypothetical protein